MAGAAGPRAQNPIRCLPVRLPPLLSSRPPILQLVLAGIVPAAFGALTGWSLGVSEPLYLVLSLLGVLGGYFAGFDHLGARAGALRGLLGGALFGGFILLVHELSGEEAKAELPEPAILLLVITTVLGMGLGALGGRSRARRERKVA